MRSAPDTTITGIQTAVHLQRIAIILIVIRAVVRGILHIIAHQRLDIMKEIDTLHAKTALTKTNATTTILTIDVSIIPTIETNQAISREKIPAIEVSRVKTQTNPKTAQGI